MNLVFERDQTQHSLTGKRHHSMMATYPILSTKKPRAQCRTVKYGPRDSYSTHSTTSSSSSGTPGPEE
ncbi:hypothetical protein QTO34_003644, partial [Cnephaeus nilssonii]